MEKKTRKKREKKKVSIINDALIEPFYIAKDELNYALYEKSPNIDKLVGYYSNLGGALHKLAELKTNYEDTYSSIKEYMNVYENHKNEIKNLINL